MAAMEVDDDDKDVIAIRKILEGPSPGLDPSLLARLGPPPKNVTLPPTQEEEDRMIKELFERSPRFEFEAPHPAIVEAIRKQVVEREKRARYYDTHKPMPKRYRTESPSRADDEDNEEEEEEEYKDEATLQKELDELLDLRRRVVDLIERRKTYAEKCAEAAAKAGRDEKGT